MDKNENLGALREVGFSKIVQAAYDQLVRDMLKQSAAFSEQYAQWRREEDARWAEKWAKMSRWERFCWRSRQLWYKTRNRLHNWQNSFRWWLSNLIYKHEESDW